MKISVIVIGMLLIAGAVIEHAITPTIIGKVNNLTNQLETGISSLTASMDGNLAYSSIPTNMNAMVTQLGLITEMIEKVSEYGMWATIIAGIGAVIYGVLAKNNRKQRIESSVESSASDILKKRLAKGEITKDEFDRLKNDVL